MNDLLELTVGEMAGSSKGRRRPAELKRVREAMRDVGGDDVQGWEEGVSVR
ncbi:MAG: hypothetical protein J7603_24645 [Pseudacidovorax sp.]|nr:hypothetical protein [Pseudacidovorax sp.]